MLPETILPPLLAFTLSPACSFDMVLVEGDSFKMGDGKSDYKSEKPVHQVTLKDYYLGKTQVTQALWKEITNGKNPSGFKGDSKPVETISWEEAKVFTKKLNKNGAILQTLKDHGLSAASFCLPSEAQWEFAARGGNYSQGYAYSGSDKLNQVGWYFENSERQTHETGLLLANELGIYDMSGNVWEWCEDDWHDNYDKAPKDGSAWIESPRGVRRIVRGGSYFDDAVYCRPTNRSRAAPGNRNNFIGFRLCLSLKSVG